jgi:hydroxymethylpyrimidine pyrophosphatase-like HAD family hydrolase
MADITVVVTDLDGTLWWGREVAHPTTRAAWAELEGKGIPVLVATGRRITSARDALGHLGLQPPSVVLNGALLVDFATGERLHRRHYRVGDATLILEAFRNQGLEPCVYVDHPDVEVFVGPRPSTHPEHLISFGTTATSGDLDDVVTSVPVFSFGMMGADPEPLARVAATLAGVAESHLGPDFYGGHTLTVAPIGLSKWIGVVAYCTQRGLDHERVLAIGDGPNDRELLTNAAVAVAPDDAHPDALAVADHVVSSPRVGGWAEILEYI